ncbi:MAG: tyrosine-type recombinase/integrase, partial [Vicinamibacteria bacterium]
LPRWKHLPAADIRRRDVRELLEKVAESGATAANRVRSLLSKNMNYGISNDVVEINPVMGTLRNPERTRDRVLTEDEIRLLWQATENLPPAMSARLRLPLVTAQRGGEVNAMRWADLDMSANVWTIPAERSKNGLAHRVPLSALALEILSTLPREDEYVLSGARGTRQLREAAREIPISDWRGHDLRRTAASYMASIGINRLVIGKVLNHVEQGITAVYDRHGYDLEKRDALNRWAQKLRSIVEAKTADVVEFRR